MLPPKKHQARWQAIEARLGREATIWFTTVKIDGRPHLVPVWFVWSDNKIYVATSSHSQKYKNLHHNQNVALALMDPYNVVILEGEAHITSHQVADKLAEYFYHKYEWDFQKDKNDDWQLIEITIHKILAWGDGYENDGIRVL